MKCLSCKITGTHFLHKICPQCTVDGVTRDDIKVESKQMTFMGDDAGAEAGKYMEKQRRKNNISHVNFKAEGTGKSLKILVTWKQYERKDGGEAHGRKETNKR